MNSSLLERALEFLKAQRKKRIWYRILACMAAVVVFVTTYMLILPAITMERKAYCGLSEHIHSEACYTEEGVFACETEEHTHGENCYLSGKANGDDGKDGEELVIDNTSYEAVYDPDYVDIKLGDPYGTGEEPVLADQTEGRETEAEEGGTEREESEYLCGLAQHVHTGECVDEEGALICKETEHIHGAACLEQAETNAVTEQESQETAVSAPAQEAETETGTGAESETEAQTETEAESGTETGIDIKTESETEAGTEAETESGTEAQTETEAESETKAQTGTETESETEVWTETEGETETDGVTEEETTEAVSEEATEAESETETGSEMETESETETGSEIETESETESETETEAESEEASLAASGSVSYEYLNGSSWCTVERPRSQEADGGVAKRRARMMAVALSDGTGDTGIDFVKHF